MAYIYVFGAISVLLSVATVILENKGQLALKYIVKTVASLCFVFVAAFAIMRAPVFMNRHVIVFLALILGMLGDIFLSSGSICKDEKQLELLNLCGLLFFLCGHILLIVWLFGFAETFNYWLLALPAVMPVLMFVMNKLKVIEPGKALVPCLAYAAVIGLMLASAINAFTVTGGTLGALIMVAAALFTVSDTCLAIFNFGKNVKAWLKYLYMPTYYVAQVLFAITILY